MPKAKRKRPLKDIHEDLYLAIQQYVEQLGGSVVAIGGIEVQQWPDDLKYNFRVAIRCTGQKPIITQAPHD